MNLSLLAEFNPPPLFMGCDCRYCVYVLQSKKDKSLYIGYTSNLKRRLDEHNKRLCPSTKNRVPLEVVAYEVYSSEIDARTREKRLKQFKNAYKELLKRIDGCIKK